MEKQYKNLDEVVIQEELADGLKLVMIPRSDYHKCFAVLTANFGSLTQTFKTEAGERIDLPAGTAHFLEHKLFDKEDRDAFERFGELGADANAFTTTTQTSYLFSTTQNVLLNLQHLLNFVQVPYFDQEKVQKEQGIISQEIQMYRDDPDWVLYMQLLGCLYPESALATDIAGTIASIQKITPTILYRVHEWFYQPSNLTLQVVGKFDVDSVRELVIASQESSQSKNTTIQVDLSAPKPMSTDKRIIEMEVARPKVAWGLRLPSIPATGLIASKRCLVADIVLELLFGEQTDWYENLYANGVIDTDFESEYSLLPNYQYFTFYSETEHYQELGRHLENQLNHFETLIANSETQFLQIKRALLGEELQRLNSLEQIALKGDEPLYGVNLFDKISMIREISYQDIQMLVKEFFTTVHLCRVVLKK